MSKKVRLLAALLAGACLTITACGDTTTVSSDTTTAGDTPDSTETETQSNLPAEYDLGGYTLRVAKQAQEKIAWSLSTFGVTEANGDVLNDAINARNTAMTEKYNFTIEETYFDTNVAPIIRSSVLSQDDEYDLAFITLSQERSPFDGTYYDFNKLPWLELSQPWWNQTLQEAMTMNGSLYFLAGDLIVSEDDGLMINIYNKDLGEDFKFENLYDVVRNGKWTIDYKKQLLTEVSADLNSDGVMDTNDRIPMFYANNSAAAPYFASANAKLFSKDGDTLTFTGNDARHYEVFEKMQSILSDHTLSYEWSQITDALPLDVMASMFDSKQALFIDGALHMLRRSLRNMDADFSILPFPKLDEEQENYYGFVNISMSHLMVPATIEHPNEVGFILEALCSASTDITSTYYKTCIEGKYVRDTDSVEMLNMISENIVYDFGFIYDWGSLGTKIQNAIMLDSGYSSLIASGKDAAISAMENYLESLAK